MELVGFVLLLYFSSVESFILTRGYSFANAVAILMNLIQVIIRIWVNGTEGENIQGLGALFGVTLPVHEKEGIRLPAIVPQPVDCCSNLSSEVFTQHVNTCHVIFISCHF